LLYRRLCIRLAGVLTGVFLFLRRLILRRQDCIQPRRRALFEFQIRQEMAVGVERELDRRMPEHFLHHFGMLARSQENRREAVTEIMRPDAWKILILQELVKFSAHVPLIGAVPMVEVKSRPVFCQRDPATRRSRFCAARCRISIGTTLAGIERTR